MAAEAKTMPEKIEILSEKQLREEMGLSRETMRKIRTICVQGQSHMLPYHALRLGRQRGIVYYRHEVNAWLAGLPSYAGETRYTPPKPKRGARARTCRAHSGSGEKTKTTTPPSQEALLFYLHVFLRPTSDPPLVSIHVLYGARPSQPNDSGCHVSIDRFARASRSRRPPGVSRPCVFIYALSLPNSSCAQSHSLHWERASAAVPFLIWQIMPRPSQKRETSLARSS